ncbi:MAG: retroviral-like aspartic protease family protein [Candidatus Obscuribacterales bacterium]|nr:retroviral-like aspartic protease family protein [Candidatus Obscuribacterales bacterium]
MLCKSNRRKATIWYSSLILALLSNSTWIARAEAQSFAEGASLYAKRQYKPALGKFQAHLRDHPEDASAYYYLGLCRQGMGEKDLAAYSYGEAVRRGGHSQAAINSLRSLLKIDFRRAQQVTPPNNIVLQRILQSEGGGAQVQAGASSVQRVPQARVTSYGTVRSAPAGGSNSSNSTSIDPSLPQEGRFNIVENPVGNSMTFVDGSINGRPVAHMIFDTGAEMVLFGKNQLEQYGIAPPTGPSTSNVHGVGGVQEAWNMKVTLKVGSIERRDFPITVQERMDMAPLLGQSFFREYQCQIDKGSKQIRLVRNDVFQRSANLSSAFASQDSVPFTRHGRLMIVQVQINGRAIPMVMDTGATNTQFTKDQLPSGVTIPQDSVVGSTSGIGGVSSNLQFPVSSLRLGPISKSNFPIQVVAQASMPYPLLGQDFFGDWRFSIDTINNQIKFHGRSGN